MKCLKLQIVKSYWRLSEDRKEWWRINQRRALKHAVTGRYRKNEILRFINETKARVLYYKYSILTDWNIGGGRVIK